jgi:hypothetical protein
MSRIRPRILLVEGKDEVRTLPELLECAGIAWGSREDPTIWIEDYGGIEDLLAPGAIEAQLLGTGRKAVGILADADGAADERWAQVRARLSVKLSGLPDALDSSGFVHVEKGFPRVGVWLMPNNTGPGMLETMLLGARKKAPVELSLHARESLLKACSIGAQLKEPHYDKGELHTWLAWQDPPGMQIHVAVKAGLLESLSPAVTSFVTWIRKLYDLQ